MSRTIRRKNAHAECRKFIYNKEEFEAGWGQWQRACIQNGYDHYVAVQKAWFYSDQPQHLHIYKSSGCPRKWRNLYAERPFRREVKRKMHHALNLDAWDDFSIRALRFDWTICD